MSKVTMSSSPAKSGGGGGTPPIPHSRRGLKGFIAEVGREMKKVNWPSRAETNRLTGVVLAVCLLITLVLVGLSTVFDTVVSIITKGGR
jgi:preprotein translocase SecE subunit